jgi:hypothetical protein
MIRFVLEFFRLKILTSWLLSLGTRDLGFNKETKKGLSSYGKQSFFKWMREPDLNQRPSGYEPDELT